VIIQSRRFESGKGVSVYGKVTSLLGFGAPGTTVRIEALSGGNLPSYFQNQVSNAFGDYAFWLEVPDTKGGRGVLRITASYSISGQEHVDIPISWGDETPETLAPPPEEKNGILDTVMEFFSTFKWIAIGAIVLVVGYFLWPFLKGKK